MEHLEVLKAVDNAKVLPASGKLFTEGEAESVQTHSNMPFQQHLGDFRERFSTRLHPCSPASCCGCDLPPAGGGQESVPTAVDHNEGDSFEEIA